MKLIGGICRAWYDRLALVLMTHYGGDVEKKREAVLVCHEGLTDPDTHLSECL
jgi:Fanconi-associated nuclease 1